MRISAGHGGGERARPSLFGEPPVLRERQPARRGLFPGRVQAVQGHDETGLLRGGDALQALLPRGLLQPSLRRSRGQSAGAGPGTAAEKSRPSGPVVAFFFC